MSQRLRVEGYNNLVKDGRSGAILNTNRTEITRARAQQKVIKEKDDTINTLSKEVVGLKQDVSEIKELLFRLIEGKATNE
jgi:hypothetical protein